MITKEKIRTRVKKTGVNFIGPIDSINGLGLSARGYVSNLLNAGIPINIINWTFGFEHVAKIPQSFPQEKKFSINIIHLNLDLITMFNSFDSEPIKNIIIGNTYNIGIVYWELMSLHPEWHTTIHRFDEIWCASSFMVKAISAVSSHPVKLVRPSITMATKIDDKFLSSINLPRDRFIFFYTFDAKSVLERKNPSAFIESFIDEFSPEDGACCLVKMMYSDGEISEINRLKILAKDRKDVIFLEMLLSDDQMSSLFHRIDCYVSPHRSEGLGLSIIEAMYSEKPVIATAYGGSSDFVTKKTAYPINYRLVEVGEGNAPYPPQYIWAEPDTESLRKLMRMVFNDQIASKQIGIEGAKHIKNLFSLNNSSEKMKKELLNSINSSH